LVSFISSASDDRFVQVEMGLGVLIDNVKVSEMFRSPTSQKWAQIDGVGHWRAAIGVAQIIESDGVTSGNGHHVVAFVEGEDWDFERTT
jgi:hypothetical protein